MSETKLLPCPFCGSGAEWWPDSGWDGKPQFVGCPNEDCIAGMYRCEPSESTPDEWNTRVPSEQEKRLEAALQEIAVGVFQVSDVNKVTMEVVSAMADIARRALEEKP